MPAYRIMVWIRNPGLERTEHALSSLMLDYADSEEGKKMYEMSLRAFWGVENADGKRIRLIQLENEKGAMRSFASEYYVSHSAGPVETFEEMQWWLPPDGAFPPEREA